MKAMVCTRFGPPAVLHKEVASPPPPRLHSAQTRAVSLVVRCLIGKRYQWGTGGLENNSLANHSGGGMVVLGEIIRNATGMDIEAFSGAYLCARLGIDPPEWSRHERGVSDASAGVQLTPRAITRIGVAYPNEGIWNGKQIASEGWIENSAAQYPADKGINIPGEDSSRVGYSYS